MNDVMAEMSEHRTSNGVVVEPSTIAPRSKALEELSLSALEANLQWMFVINFFPVVVALREPDTFPVDNINCRYYFHLVRC